MESRRRERGSISGGPLLGLLVTGAAAAFVGIYLLPEAARSSPSLPAVAARMPTWLAIVLAAVIYVAPVALAALQWHGFSDRESPRDKLIGGARAFGFAPGAALGALIGGGLGWVFAGAAAGAVGGVIVAALLRAALGPPALPGDKEPTA